MEIFFIKVGLLLQSGQVMLAATHVTYHSFASNCCTVLIDVHPCIHVPTTIRTTSSCHYDDRYSDYIKYILSYNIHGESGAQDDDIHI